MAEGVEVEIPSSVAQKYFCHDCSRVFTGRYLDLTCVRCQSDFIEEVPDCNDGSDESELDFEPTADALWMAQEQNDPFRRLIRRTIAHTIYDFDHRDSLNPPTRSLLQDWLLFHGVNDESVPSASREEPDDDMGLQFFRELLLSRNLGDLGDYAIGLEWDAVITQILNESEVNGPPPLAKDDIEAIPIMSIQEEHIVKGIQCTICMEDFKLEENVKLLQCEHFYHPECIVPWLERHATCPICRQQFSGEKEQSLTNHERMLAPSDCSSTTSNASSNSATTTSSDSSSSSSSSSSTTSTSSESTSDASTNSYQSSSSSSPSDCTYDLSLLTLRFN